MQTVLADFIRDTPEGREADAILRKCVHCGFCTATCPTYQLLGDELDGPRGRIYLIKQALEGAPVSARTRLHLDRCLTCRACETTCPSGVRYGRLVDIGRKLVEERARRGAVDRALRAALGFALPRTRLFGAALRLGQWLRPLLPAALRSAVPAPAPAPGTWPVARHARRMLTLAGCVQPVLAPRINAAAARVLDRVGISLVEAPAAGCCGALRFHLNDQAGGLADMRALIDAWWPLVERGEAEAGALERLLAGAPARGRVAFQAPCSLQHGQGIRGLIEGLLARAGYQALPVPDAHLCCGSAGTYSILQPQLSRELRARKLAALRSGVPDAIASANIGCLAHLQAASDVPVRHWIELLDDALGAVPGNGGQSRQARP